MNTSIVHRAFPPLCGDKPRVLILGTFPSPISREKGEYYGNPRNQFWRIVFKVFEVSFDEPDYNLKKALLMAGGIALWDVITTCEVSGALDSAISNPVFNTELPDFIECNGIRKIFFNGNNAYTFYRRGIGMIDRNIPPSTSPAYAAMRFEEKLRLWRGAVMDK